MSEKKTNPNKNLKEEKLDNDKTTVIKNNVKFTENQTNFINKKNSNILVSAGAGSGKTTSMTKKIIELVKEGVPLNTIVVLTFTKSQANDMLIKIRKELINLNLGEINLNLESANIGTIHSFLFNIIKEYENEIDIPFDSNYSPLEENEEYVIKENAFKKLVERLKNKMSEYEKSFILSFAKINNLNNIKEMLFSLDRFLEKVEDEEEFLSKCQDESFYKSEYINKTFRESFKLKQELVKENDNSCFYLIESDYIDELNKKSEKVSDSKLYSEIKRFKTNIKNLHEALLSYDIKDTKILTSIYDEILNFNADIRGMKTLLNKIKDNINKNLGFLPYLTEELLKKNIINIKTLLSLYYEYKEYVNLDKQEQKKLSFSDMEKYALHLLKNEKVKIAIKNSIAYMFVDEYQDTSYIQEKIFEQIAPENNSVCIGDIKQSIYRFRNAEPTIFNNRLKKYLSDKNTGTVIPFNENFRSTKNIIDFVNQIFSNIMSENVIPSSINYSEQNEEGFNLHILNYPENSPNVDDSPINVITSEVFYNEYFHKDIYSSSNGKALLSEQKNALKEVLSKYGIKTAVELEAYFVASEIYRLKSENSYTYKDFTVVSRNNHTLDVFSNVFQTLGIPSSSRETEDIFSYPEVNLLINMLEVISGDDNDISLLAFLKSDIFSFNESELLLIKEHTLKNKNEELTNSETIPLIECVNEYAVCGENENLKKKVQFFLDELEGYKKIESENNLTGFLNIFLVKSGFLEHIYASLGNLKKANNIEKIISLANNYKKNNISDLLGFIHYLQVIKDNSISINANNIFQKGDNKVNLTTIHSSKGLEYKVMFFVNTNLKTKRVESPTFNIKEDLGISLPLSIDENNKQFILNPFNVIANFKESLEEEEEVKRLLYVALTRAKEKLYVINFALRNNKDSYFRLIIDNCNKEYVKKIDPKSLESRLNINKYKSKKSDFDFIMNKIDNQDIDTEEKNRFEELINQKYTYKNDILIKPKLSVSEILDNRIFEEKTVFSEDEDKGDFDNQYKKSIDEFDENNDSNEKTTKISKNNNNEEKELLIKRGTVMHNVFSKIVVTNNNLENLFKLNLLDDEDHKFIDEKAVDIFCNSQLLKEIRNSKQVFSETVFTASIDDDSLKDFSELLENKNKENEISLKVSESGEMYDGSTLIQGVFDLYYIDNNDDIFLIDYKSSKNNIEKSMLQLGIYRSVLERIYNKKVKSSGIYIFRTGEIIELE